MTLRVIEKCGSDEKRIPPIFNDIKLKVKIAHIAVVNIEDLTANDFVGSSSDVQDIYMLKKHLCSIYGKNVTDYDNKDITKINLEYLD